MPLMQASDLNVCGMEFDLCFVFPFRHISMSLSEYSHMECVKWFNACEVRSSIYSKNHLVLCLPFGYSVLLGFLKEDVTFLPS